MSWRIQHQSTFTRNVPRKSWFHIGLPQRVLRSLQKIMIPFRFYNILLSYKRIIVIFLEWRQKSKTEESCAYNIKPLTSQTIYEIDTLNKDFLRWNNNILGRKKINITSHVTMLSIYVKTYQNCDTEKKVLVKAMTHKHKSPALPGENVWPIE